MTNAEHIIAWAENDRSLYDRLCNFEAKREGKLASIRAQTAFDIAKASYIQGRSSGDIVEPHSPADILDAAKLVLEWTKEG